MNSGASPESSFVTTPFAECDADLFGFSTAGDYAPPELEEIDLLRLEPLADSPVELRDSSPSVSPKPEPEREKKPAKKRKSWGQELPTPTTNLPPRKRAKTAAEKEQRRIERVLRNRAAAQASRERRRKELEELEDEKAILEKDNSDLKTRLSAVEEENASLAKRVEEMQRQLKSFEDSIKAFTSMGGNMVGRPSPSFQVFPNDVTLDLSSIIPIPTSTAPTPKPPVESNKALGMTHQSAALMCDLQCLSIALNPQDPPAEVAAIWLLQFVLLEVMASTLYSIQIPFLQLFLNLKKGTPIPTSDLMRYFPLIRWLVTAKPTRQLFQRLLKCSPALALPQDATGRAMLTQMAQSTSGRFGQGMTDDDDEDGNALNAVSECRRIVRELRSTMVMGDLRFNKMGGTGDGDSHACALDEKPGGDRGA